MRFHRFVVVILLLLSLSSACGSSAEPAATMTEVPTTTETPGTGGCSGPLADPGEYEGLNVVGATEGAYWIVVPGSYQAIAPAPLYLHLAAGDGDHNGNLAGWRPYLDDLDGLMVIPNTADPLRGRPEALIALIAQISNEYCVDSDRIHVMGTSWSGGMAERLACEASDQIASFASAISEHVPTPGCDPTRPVPLLTFTGNDDRYWVEGLVARWVDINECDTDPAVEDLGSGVARKSYVGCVADVVFYDITTMDHAWPLHEAIGPGAPLIAEYAEVDYLDETLQFFAEHPLP